MIWRGGDAVNTEALAGVEIFAELAAARLAELAAAARQVSVRTGEVLFEQGGRGDAMFVVLSGRLEAVAGTPPRVLRVLRRGEAVGELALLTGSPRSASVRARRDSELLRVDAADVTRLLAEEPAFAAALTRALATQLQASRGLDVEPSPIPETIGVAALPGAPAAARLAGTLGDLMGRDRVTILTAAEAGRREDHPGVLDRAEREHRQVLLAAEPGDGDWRDFCLRQADRLLVLGAGAAATGGPRLEAEGRIDVLVAGPATPGALAAWIGATGAHAGRLVGEPERWPRSLAPLARALGGKSVALVCSGGGARGFAHIGVIAALQEAGVTIDRLAGVSMGAVVAGLTAMGATPDEIHDRCTAEFVHGRPIGDYTLPVVALVRGRNAEAILARLFGGALIEELAAEFCCVSCDLLSSELVHHRRGLLAEAVGASMCLPGIGPPVAMDGRLLVDGGVMDNLPVEAVSGSGEGPVIASDVTAPFELPVRRARTGAAARRLRDGVLGRGSHVPLRLPEIIARSITVGSIDTVQAAERHATAVIRPDVGGVGMLAFDQIDPMVRAGRQAAQTLLESRPDLAP